MRPFHIESGQRADVALTIAQGVAQLTQTVSEIAQIPGLGPAATAIQVIISVCQTVKMNK
jgi:hypothetical protein